MSIRVRYEDPRAASSTFCFQEPFRIGRGDDAELCIKNDYVSRYHLKVLKENGVWTIVDLNSSNGIFLEGLRVDRIKVDRPLSVRLGIEGPFVHFEPEPIEPRVEVPMPPAIERPTAPWSAPTSKKEATASKPKNVDRYFGKLPATEPIGEQTMMIREAFAQVQKKQKRKYGGVMAALGIGVLAISGYAWYLHQQVAKQRATAVELFYAMKEMDLSIANVEKMVRDSNSKSGAEQLNASRNRRKDMEQKYDKFLEGLHIYDAKMTPQERLVLRVARIFGECELDMPKEFMTEINSYISKWQSSPRMAKALKRARDNSFIPFIAKELLDNDLPPQFLYLAMQESDFDEYISGPQTYMGFAKGMWQFIPKTAVQYGLKVGPLVDRPVRDPSDDRHHWELATKAAAAYLKDLYRTDAKASGFLVMACYNWGEHKVLPLVQRMPDNPKERNFWKLLAMGKDKIPQETYDYVFYIASAAVIGEDPKLFGFDFDKPLGYLEGSSSTR